VRVAFEEFALVTKGCDSAVLDEISVEYGRGPKRQPVTRCCGDLIPRDPLAMIMDLSFKRFDA
jgi:hypothetical protein